MRKKLLLILLCCLCGVSAAVGGAVWWASSHMRSPEFHVEFVRMLREATGREVGIQGALEVSVFPWFGLTARGFSLGNDPDFGPEPLLTASALSAHIKVLPLFQRRLVFDTVDLEGARLALVLDQDKRGNWDGLVERLRAEENATGSERDFFRKVTVRGLRISGGAANLDDQRHGFTFSATDVALRTGRIESGRALPFTVSCAFDWPQPGLVSRLEATGRLNWSGRPGAPLLEETTAQGEIGGAFMPKDSPRAVLSTAISLEDGNRHLRLSGARLKVLGAEFSGQVIFFDVTEGFRMEARLAAQPFNPRAVVNAYWPGAVALEHKDALHTAEGPLNLLGNEDELVFESPGLKLDGSTLRGRVRLGFGDRPGLDFELSADRLDADAYATAFAANSTTPPLVVDDLPMRFLRRVEGKGLLRVEHLRLAGVAVQGAELSWQAGGGQHRAQLKPGKSQGGRVSGDVSASFAGGPPDPAAPDAKAAPVSLGFSGALHMDDVDARQVSWLNRPGVSSSGELDLRANAEAARAVLPGALKLSQVLRRATVSFNANLNPATLEFAPDAQQAKAGKAPLRMSFSSIQAQARLAPPKAAPPAQGDWTVQADGSFSAVGVKPQLNLDARLTGQLRSGARGGTVLSAATATGRLRGWFLPRRENEASFSFRGQLDFPAQSLSIASLAVQTCGLNLVGAFSGAQVFGRDAALSGRIRCQDGDPKRLLNALEVRIPKSADRRAFTRMSGEADLTLNSKGLSLANLSAQLDDMPVRGSYAVQGFSAPRQVFALSAGNLDLDRYLAAPEPVRRGAPQDRPAPETLPVDTVRELSAEGSLAFRSFKLHGLTTRELKLSLSAKDGSLTVKPIAGSFYGGSLSGEFSAQATPGGLSTRLALAAKDFQAGPFMIAWAGKEYVTGHADLFFDLGGAGATDQEVLRTLEGLGEFRITDGSYALSGAADQSSAPSAPASAPRRPPGATGERYSTPSQPTPARRPGTPFRQAGARLKVHKGVFASDDFRLDGPNIQVTGKGRFSVAEDSIAVTLSAAMPGFPDVPLRVHGRLKDPEMEVPTGAFINNTIKELLGLPFKPIKFFKDLLF